MKLMKLIWGLLQVQWWCVTVLYLVGLRHCCELPADHLGAAIASLMQYRLDSQDIYFEAQILLWQASRHLPLSINPAISNFLDGLICQDARVQVIHTLHAHLMHQQQFAKCSAASSA